MIDLTTSTRTGKHGVCHTEIHAINPGFLSRGHLFRSQHRLPIAIPPEGQVRGHVPAGDNKTHGFVKSDLGRTLKYLCTDADLSTLPRDFWRLSGAGHPFPDLTYVSTLQERQGGTGTHAHTVHGHHYAACRQTPSKYLA
jgi:hypothetical protein